MEVSCNVPPHLLESLRFCLGKLYILINLSCSIFLRSWWTLRLIHEPSLSWRREILALWRTEEVSIQQAQGLLTHCTTLGSSCQRSSWASGNLCCCWKCHKIESRRRISRIFSRTSASHPPPEESKSCSLTAKAICTNVSVFKPSTGETINSQNTFRRITSAEKPKRSLNLQTPKPPKNQLTLLTFHHIDQRANGPLLDDAGVLPIIHRVHAVHHLMDLRQLQVLHEVVVQDGVLDHLLGPVGEVTCQELRTCLIVDSYGVIAGLKGINHPSPKSE